MSDGDTKADADPKKVKSVIGQITNYWFEISALESFAEETKGMQDPIVFPT